MTALDPPQQDPPAGAVRALLQAIRDYLDLPAAALLAEDPEREAELQDRVAEVIEWLETVLAGGSIALAAETIRADQARLLPFEPETPAQAAERQAKLAALLAERRRSGLNGDTADRGQVGQ